MGSDSDLPVMAKAAEVLEFFSVEFSVIILSAHRTPVETMEFAARAEEEGYGVLIAGAGMAAHLPGVLAAKTSIPVVGVPIACGPLRGEDALYSMVQMPSGIPVATVGINCAKNAALLAVAILALSDPVLKEKLSAYRQSLREECRRKAKTLAQKGYKELLEEK
ncbi:MAG TPA: 5-(carboxyamino)imidazole ribonucleotide mutase [Firmicutes bacterium]|jgi:5-(carboxyamino)imidazole ribonucleotide mutase|nr:5-(carboxyamino)imidazole ribonucleotide mutase [Bacillota bacterium]